MNELNLLRIDLFGAAHKLRGKAGGQKTPYSNFVTHIPQ